MIESSRECIAAARYEAEPAAAYVAAHLGALRAAAALVAAQPTAGKRGGRRRPSSVWDLLTAAEPRLADWAAYFAATARKRTAAEAGLTRSISRHEADDLLCEASAFLSIAEELLGMSAQPVLPLRSVG